MKQLVLRVGTWTFLMIVFSALIGEISCVLEYRSERKRAEAFALHSPNLFRAQGAREAGHKSLWKRPFWEYRPGAHFEKEIGGQSFVVNINSQGFRTHEFTTRKPPGEVRVVCIGGSTTVEGRTNEETYPAILERSLRETFPQCSIEVLNFGISATDSGRWLGVDTDLFRYEPDIVVQYDAVNDIMRTALPHFTREHPWRSWSYRSLLVERLFPIAPGDFDLALSEIVDAQIALSRLCRLHKAEHLSGSFAAPDYETASAEERAHLDVDLAEGWTSWPGTLQLRQYRDYARILARYNALFERAVLEGRLNGVMIHRAVSKPELFVDLCHMTQAGISELAGAFRKPVSEIVKMRCTSPVRHDSSGS